MDRDFLADCLARGMSLPEIGALTNRDPSTVGYWVKKYGLVANGRARYSPRGGLTKDQLTPLVEAGFTQAEIANKLGRGLSSVRHWLKEHGLETRTRRGRRSAALHRRIEAAVRDGRREVLADASATGRQVFAIVEPAGRRIRCKLCRSEAVARRRQRVKETLAQENGGECLICGYRRCIAALRFHHLDPETKSFGIAHRGLTRAIEEVRREAEECVLLCANCHIEVEVGLASLPEP
jgi:hypothetical protein